MNSGKKDSGDDGEGETPVPIPNTEVKPFSADGTGGETLRESRSLPDYNYKNLVKCRVFYFPFKRKSFSFLK